MIIGIDTGGTNVDAALIDADGVQRKAKVPNTDTRESIEAVLADLVEAEESGDIERVVVATTLVVNAAVQRRLPACTNILIPGPGLSPTRAFFGEENYVASGGIDPRGRVTEPVAFDEEPDHPVTAITAKFSARNPDLERELRDDIAADHVAIGSESGAGFTFPERAATTVANAKSTPVFAEYERDVEAAVDAVGIDAPVYYLKGDGAMLSAESMLETPAHTLRGGSAASALGLVALTGVADAMAVDIGGTTTDVTRIEDGYPDVEADIAEADIEPAYDGVVSKSVPLGGDSTVEIEDGSVSLVAEREGNAAAFGGSNPTVTDALHVLDVFTDGDVDAAVEAMRKLGDEPADSIARAVLDSYVERIATAIDELRKSKTSALAVGGVLAPHLAERLAEAVGIDDIRVPDDADVAGAIGCGVARVSVETAVHADSARGILTVTSIGPESVESIEEGRRFTNEQARDIAIERARNATAMAGGDEADDIEVLSFDRFSVVVRNKVAGQIFDAEARVTPGIEYQYAEGNR